MEFIFNATKTAVAAGVVDAKDEIEAEILINKYLSGEDVPQVSQIRKSSEAKVAIGDRRPLSLDGK